MKLYKKYIYGFAFLAASLSSCTGDLNVTPIDPNLNTPDKVLTSESDYKALLAKCYSALSVSSPEGSSGSPDIAGIDGGFGQYLRALFNLNELPTDEAVIGWNDQTIKDLHGLSWSSSDVFVSAMYGRLFYQIALCSEVVRQIKASGDTSDEMKTYAAEARCLRALSYYHAIDMYGNVPFVTEDQAIGGTNPKQISRADLFKWLTEEEIPGFIDDLKPARTNESYRADQGLAYMIMAKLYLNAEVYTGTPMYDKCAEYCQKIIDAGYTLEPTFANLFKGDNDKCLSNEIIFSVYQDEYNTQAYGGTTYLVIGSIGGSMKPADYGLTASGWGGLRVTPQFVDKFSSGDVRGNFYTKGQTKDIADISEFTNGYAYPKYTNLNSDGTSGEQGNFVNADFVIFRLADVYLMMAECQLRGVNVDGLKYFNLVRKRAGVGTKTSITLDDVLDERARELAWECHRRSDLVRFGELTTDKYIWAWKGKVKDGISVDSKYNLYPLPSSDVNANTNLTQNTGY